MQRAIYFNVGLPKYRILIEALSDLSIVHRRHLQAMECLRRAKLGLNPKNDVIDPLRVAEFCNIGAIRNPSPFGAVTVVSFFRNLVNAIKDGTASAPFDITKSLSLGLAVIARMGPLIGRLQMREAPLWASTVAQGNEEFQVIGVLESAGTEDKLRDACNDARVRLESKWKEVQEFSDEMERVRVRLGISEDE
jgi:hypothetical protein